MVYCVELYSPKFSDFITDVPRAVSCTGLRDHGSLLLIHEWGWKCRPRPLETGFMQRCFCVFFKFIYFWLHWVFFAARELSLVAASGGYSSLRCAGFSLRWLLLCRSTGSRCAGSVVVPRGL